jgi:hypothetical protein
MSPGIKPCAIIVATVILAAGCATTPTENTAWNNSYSIEATMTREKDKGTYEVVVRVSKLVERDGALSEDLISLPKITSAPGVPASLYVGLQPPHPEYAKAENVSADVSWPDVGKRDFAVCTVTVKVGDRVVSKTKMKVTVDEP